MGGFVALLRLRPGTAEFPGRQRSPFRNSPAQGGGIVRRGQAGRRDVDEAVIRGRTEVLREILPVIDSIDMAIDTVKQSHDVDGIVEGVGMVKHQFLNATERFDLKSIQSVGHSFDPNFHEAVAQVDSEEMEVGQVLSEMRGGYMLGDRLLRAAMVVVSRGKPSPSNEAASPPDELDGVEESASDEGNTVEENEGPAQAKVDSGEGNG
jgi:hypothetical protein